MRYFATLKGARSPIPVEIEEQQGRFTVTLDGKSHQLEAVILPHRAISLLMDGNSYEVEVMEEEETQLSLLVRNQRIQLQLVEARRATDGANGRLALGGKQVVTAPMPGKVVRVLVRQGDLVQEGQGLVVVEAMKMENELKSPKTGRVVELLAREGSAVENNAKLVVIE